jgi:hypothetical protein
MGKKRVSKGETPFFASICSCEALLRPIRQRQGAPALTKGAGACRFSWSWTTMSVKLLGRDAHALQGNLSRLTSF